MNLRKLVGYILEYAWLVAILLALFFLSPKIFWAFIVLSILILIFGGLNLYGKYLKDTAEKREIIKCPHGFEDWDECPDCRH